MRALIFAALACLFATTAPAQTDQRQHGFEIGRLECTGSEFRNRIVRSEMSLECEFLPVVGEPEAYTGQMTRTGVDLTIRRRFVIVWLVLNPTDVRYEPGALRGTYVGGTADVSLGLGVGANVMVGSGPNSFTLQPLSVAGMVGSGVSLAASRLVLE